MLGRSEYMQELIEQLSRLGRARDRYVDHEMREVTITDEESLNLVLYIEHLEQRK